MKISTTLFTVAIASLLSVTVHAKNVKIGIVDYQMVLSKSKMAKEMSKEIEKKFKSHQQDFIAKQTKLQEMSNKLNRNRAIMKPADIEKLQEQTIQLRTELERKGQDLQRQLQLAQSKATRKFTLLVQEKVAAIGKKRKFDLILQSTVAPYYKPELDITADVRKAID